MVEPFGSVTFTYSDLETSLSGTTGRFEVLTSGSFSSLNFYFEAPSIFC
jgi:hypothetical protein